MRESGQGTEVGEIRRLARETVDPDSHGEHGRVNRPVLKALGEAGILAKIFPKEFGGARTDGISAMELCRFREGLSTESTDAELVLALQGLGSYPIVQSGSPELAGHWIPQVVSGDAVAAFALSEPEAGSDAAALSCRAERDGDGYRLTGTKTWISNAPEADVYTVFARTTEGARARGVTAFVVAGDAPGLSGEPIQLIAPHAIGRLDFDGVYVPADHVLGEVDRGFSVAMRTLDLFRPSVGAAAVGMAQAALELSVAHADSRSAFGQPIRRHQAVAHQLADMATRLQAARLLVYDAAAHYDRGSEEITKSAAMAKLFATETAQFVIDTAVQINGARGLEAGHLLERLYREVRALRIYEGTSEIQRTIVSRELFR